MIFSSLTSEQMANYLIRQVNNIFPDQVELLFDLESQITSCYEKLEFCFSNIKRKYYYDDEKVIFNHLNSDQYATFLYFLANQIYKELKVEDFPAKLFYLNKIMNGLDLFYKVEMPEIFLLVHPVGTVIGNAKFSNYLVIYQNCSIGSDESGIYPEFGEGVILYSKSSVIGNCKIGSNVVIAANSFILNQDIPNDSIAIGSYPHNKIAPNKLHVIDRRFN